MPRGKALRTNIVQDDPLLDTHNAAAYLGNLAPGTLIRWRVEKSHLSYIKLNDGAVRYRQSELDRFIDANSVQIPTHSVPELPA